MGYMRHHAIVVTSWKQELLEQAHAKATELGQRNPEVPPKRLWQVSEITPESTNCYRSFLVAPDGSKEGWDTSDAADAARAEFVQWLDEQRYEDRSTALDWVVVQFGDENRETRIIRDSDQYARDNPWTDEDDAAWAAAHN